MVGDQPCSLSLWPCLGQVYGENASYSDEADMKVGCTGELLHFHGFPLAHTDVASERCQLDRRLRFSLAAFSWCEGVRHTHTQTLACRIEPLRHRFVVNTGARFKARHFHVSRRCVPISSTSAAPSLSATDPSVPARWRRPPP